MTARDARTGNRHRPRRSADATPATCGSTGCSRRSSRSRAADAAAATTRCCSSSSTRSSELWMKLMIHELEAAIAHVRRDRPRAVLQDPRAREADPEAAVRAVGGARDADAVGVRAFRPSLGPSSGLPVGAVPRDRVPARQQAAAMLDVFRHDPATHARARRGCSHAPVALRRVPAAPRAPRHCRCRADASSATVTQPYVRDPDLVAGVQARSTRIPSAGGTRTTCARSSSTSRRASSSGASVT